MHLSGVPFRIYLDPVFYVPLRPPATICEPFGLKHYGLGDTTGAGAGGFLNLVSSTGTLSLISVNLRVELQNESIAVIRIVKGTFIPSTSR